MIFQLKKLGLTFLALLVLFALGTLGYMQIENASFFNSLYMTVITLSTVGFGEIIPLTPQGRVFTMILIISGISFFLYLLSTITSILLEGFIINYFKGVKMKKMIDNLKNHCIIIGYGRTGENLVENFMEKNIPFVLIEKNSDTLDLFKAKYPFKNCLYILGDATDDQILLLAGIKKATTLIPVLSNDADNLFTVLSAKLLNPEIHIISRVNDIHNYEKLKKAGASIVLSPHEITAKRLFNLATENNLMTFLDLMEHYSNAKELSLAKLTVSPQSSLVNKNLIEAEIPKKTGLIVIGIGKKDLIDFNPKPQSVINIGDTLIIMGNPDQIKKLENIC